MQTISVHKNKYKFGVSRDLVYPAHGTSADWAHEKLGIKYTYILELKPTLKPDEGYLGFLLPVDEIKVRNIWAFSPLVPSKQEKTILVLLNQFCSVCIFVEGSVFTFQFLNDKIHNYGFFDIIVNFIIQKLKSEHTSLKKYTN